jgi:hypothetical protein
MANQNITQLTELTDQDIDTDVFIIVDISDTTMNASGTNKKITGENVRSRATNTVYDDATNSLGDNVQEAMTTINEVVNNVASRNQGSWLVTGGGVSWDVNLNVVVAAATYYIQGVLIEAPQATLTLDAADATHPRFDAIVANADGTITEIAGTPAATPVTPSIDPTTQLVLAYIRVDATATDLVVDTAIIYRENVEWTTSSNSGNIVANSATDPFAGTLCVRMTNAAAANAITFTGGGQETLADYGSLNMFIRFSSWPSTKSLVVSLINTATNQKVGIGLRPGQHGLVDGITTYQLVSIPLSVFPSMVTANRLEIAVAGGGAALSLAIDNIELIAFTNSPPPPGKHLSSINGLDPENQLLAVGTAGTDFNIVSSRDTHTFNLPDASTSNRGAVTTGTQTLGGAKTFDKTVQVTERTQTPAGTTATIDLTEGNHQTLTLASSSGNVTATLTVPAGTSAGTIIVVQHGTTPRDITWSVSSGTILWDVEPTWSDDAVSSIRIVPWRWNGTQMFLAASGVFA